MRLLLLDARLAVCQLDPERGLPSWFSFAPPLSAAVVRHGELTIVAPVDDVPDSVTVEKTWCAFEVGGPLDLTMTGVMSSLSAVLASAGVALFAVSSYDTDVLLVRDHHLERAAEAFRSAGHEVVGL